MIEHELDGCEDRKNDVRVHVDRESHETCNPTTSVVVNNQRVYIHVGEYAVATVKKLAGVPLADDLDQLIDSTLKPVCDDATLHLRGCEIFISHVKDGGSS